MLVGLGHLSRNALQPYSLGLRLVPSTLLSVWLGLGLRFGLRLVYD